MTKREAKAVELVRCSILMMLYGKPVSQCTDEEILKSDYCQSLLSMARWQALQSQEAFVKRWIPYLNVHSQDIMDASILNAGTEEA